MGVTGVLVTLIILFHIQYYRTILLATIPYISTSNAGMFDSSHSMYADCTVYAFLHAVMVDTCSGEAPLSKINGITEISEDDPEFLGR